LLHNKSAKRLEERKQFQQYSTKEKGERKSMSETQKCQEAKPAALSEARLFKMVAPSFVIVISFAFVVLCNILSIPFGPRVDFTRSFTAIAPTKLD
jgi:hypothetical protein